MVRFKRLDLRGFMRFARPASFAFSDGLNIILGPIGSGKTTVIEGVLSALFGPGRGGANRLLSRGANLCSASLEYEWRGASYRVERDVMARYATLGPAGRGVGPVLAGARSVDAAIKGRMGVRDRGAFEAACLVNERWMSRVRPNGPSLSKGERCLLGLERAMNNYKRELSLLVDGVLDILDSRALGQARAILASADNPRQVLVASTMPELKGWAPPASLIVLA